MRSGSRPEANVPAHRKAPSDTGDWLKLVTCTFLTVLFFRLLRYRAGGARRVTRFRSGRLPEVAWIEVAHDHSFIHTVGCGSSGRSNARTGSGNVRGITVAAHRNRSNPARWTFQRAAGSWISES